MKSHAKQVSIQEYALMLLGEVMFQPRPPHKSKLKKNGSYDPYQFLPLVENPELVEVVLSSMRMKQPLVSRKAVSVALKVMKAFPESSVIPLEGLGVL
jgi:hypothetical protein